VDSDVSNLLNQDGVVEKLLSTTDENGEKNTLYIVRAQLATVCTNV